MMLHRFNFDAHYETVKVWLDHYKWPGFEPGILPQFGLIVSDGDDYICCGFLYKTDSCISLLEWVVGNPNIDYEKRALGINTMVKALLREAKDQGFGAVLSFIQNKRLIEKYKETGFIVTDENMTHGMWRI